MVIHFHLQQREGSVIRPRAKKKNLASQGARLALQSFFHRPLAEALDADVLNRLNQHIDRVRKPMTTHITDQVSLILPTHFDVQHVLRWSRLGGGPLLKHDSVRNIAKTGNPPSDRLRMDRKGSIRWSQTHTPSAPVTRSSPLACADSGCVFRTLCRAGSPLEIGQTRRE